MSEGATAFSPFPALVQGFAARSCRACVTVPARNEAASLPRCLDALRLQQDDRGRPVLAQAYEVLLLLNNCTDDSATVARRWQTDHPNTILHIVECTLPPEQANVGKARQLLMDTAWRRLRHPKAHTAAILSTDADSAVAPDWLWRNLCALEAGADVVGGKVHLLPEDILALPESVQRCYRLDRRYEALVARLEDLLDPQPGDRWPRHLDHFGASLACTPEAYAAAGGMPPLSALEDEAFVDRVRRAGLCLRHDPDVHVYTSARLTGRAPCGMARQLQLWRDLPSSAAHTVPSAAFLIHRFGRMRQLRKIYAKKDVGDLTLPTDWWRETFREALATETCCPGFLGAVYCDILIAEAFMGEAEEPIENAVRKLERFLRQEQRPAQRALRAHGQSMDSASPSPL